MSSLIRSEALFPLGPALVGLSLGDILAAMREPDEVDSNEAVADLKTASRLLPAVYSESEHDMETWLTDVSFGSGSRDSKIDDEDLQQTISTNIASPLLEDYKGFEGKSRIR